MLVSNKLKNIPLSENVFIPSSFLKDISIGNRIHDWQLFSCSTWKILYHFFWHPWFQTRNYYHWIVTLKVMHYFSFLQIFISLHLVLKILNMICVLAFMPLCLCCLGLWFLLRNIYLTFVPVSGTKLIKLLEFPKW